MRATWAPRGRTPVLRHRFGWKRLSMSAAVAYASHRGDARIVFQTHAGAYNDESLIEFLDALHDELGAHQGDLDLGRAALPPQPQMQAYIRAQRRGCRRSRAAIPRPNPVEAVWGNIKGRDLANLCADSIDEPAHAAHCGIDRVRADIDLAVAFFAAAAPAMSRFGVVSRPLTGYGRRQSIRPSAISDPFG